MCSLLIVIGYVGHVGYSRKGCNFFQVHVTFLYDFIYIINFILFRQLNLNLLF